MVEPLSQRLKAIARKGLGGLLIIALLTGVGIALKPLQAPVWATVKADQPELDLESLDAALGQGLVLGVLGGFRAMVADLLYIRAYMAWEKKDLGSLETLLPMVVAIDPRPYFFWGEGALMLGFDTPVWLIRQQGGIHQVPEGVQQRLFHQQANRALGFLEKAERWHDQNPRWYQDQAHLHWHRLGDRAAAASLYQEAATLPDSPFGMARIYGILMEQLERYAEAADFLEAYRQQRQDRLTAHERNLLEEDIAHYREQAALAATKP